MPANAGFLYNGYKMVVAVIIECENLNLKSDTLP